MSLQRRFKKSAVAQIVPVAIRQTTALEKHYTAAEVGSMWGLSDDSVRNIFANDPRVLRIGSSEPHRKGEKFVHQYVSMRIPESVVKEVYETLRIKRAS